MAAKRNTEPSAHNNEDRIQIELYKKESDLK
jgi:hypothetical protein